MTNFTGTSGNDIFTGGADTDYASGAGGNDTLSGGGGNDQLEGNNGADTLNGGDGDDNLYSQDVDPNFPFPGFLSAGVSNDVYADQDTLNGGAGDDYIFAGYGDTVDGGAQGSYGNRLYISFLGASSGVNADFTILQNTGSITIGGATITNIQEIGFLQGSNYDDVLVPIDTYYPSGGSVYGMGGNDQITAGYYSGWGGSALYGGDGDDVIDGRPAQYGPALYGDAGNDTIYGNSYSFAGLFGGDGNDTLYAASNASGGEGDDTIIKADGYYSQNRVAGDGGDDTIMTTSAFGDVVAGGAGADVITGSNANDTLGSGDFVDANSYEIADDLGTEQDSISAGNGDDHISAGYGDDVDGGNGTDVLRLSLGGLGSGITLNTAGITSPGGVTIGGGTIQNVETLEYLRGTEFADRITAATQATLLTINAGAGDDLIISQNSSVDVMGGAGDDRLVSGPAGDIFDGGAGSDTIDYRQVGTGVTVTLSSDLNTPGTGAGGDQLISVENVLGTAFADTLTGNDSVNRLVGGAGNDWLDGGAGADQLIGGAGDDTFVVDNASDYTAENAGEGTDTVMASVFFSLRSNIENLTLTGAADLVGKGNELVNVITGNSGNNGLYGYAGGDWLYGNEGNDTLDGGVGADHLYGGTGDDSYIVDNAGDVVVENSGEGTADRVYSSIAYTLGANVEQLTLTGSADVNGSGNALDNRVVGNSGANTLYGLDGNDVVNGGAGADTLDGGAGGDTLLGGLGDDKLYGRDGDDLLKGDDGNDRLDGGAGRDSFYGGAGADVFTFRDGDFAGLTTTTSDRIYDFSQADGDRIRVTLVDANTTMDGDQAFSFVGSSAFSGTAGELRYEQINGSTYVEGDTNGDGVADFMIRLDGLHALVSADFAL